MAANDTSNPLGARPNSTVDDIAAVIGFTATLRLCAWYGDRKAPLYVPNAATPDHEVARLIGPAAFKRLVDEWGNEHLSISSLSQYEDDCRNRLVRDLFSRGHSPSEISRITKLGERRLQQLRVHLEESGMLPVVLTGRGEKHR